MASNSEYDFTVARPSPIFTAFPFSLRIAEHRTTLRKNKDRIHVTKTWPVVSKRVFGVPMDRGGQDVAAKATMTIAAEALARDIGYLLS